MRRTLVTAAGVIVWLIALALAATRIRGTAASGVDVVPIYEAGRAVLHGQPVYDVPAFVYPPFAAVAMIPISALSLNRAFDVWRVLQVVVPLIACPFAARSVLPWRRAWPLAGLLVVLLLKGDVFVDSLFLFNPTLLFVLPAVAVPLLWSRNRWVAGAALLGLSLAIKPLLVLYVLIPVVLRQWRAVAWTVGTAAGLTLVGAAVSHDLGGLIYLPQTIATSTNLHGELLTHNVNLASVREAHPTLTVVTWLALLLVLTSVVGVLLGMRRVGPSASAFVAASGALALAPALAGSIDEIHYGVLGLPALVAILAQHRRLVPFLTALAATAVLLTPRVYLRVDPLSYNTSQLRWAVGQLLVIMASGLYFSLWGPGHTPLARRRPQLIPLDPVS